MASRLMSVLPGVMVRGCSLAPRLLLPHSHARHIHASHARHIHASHATLLKQIVVTEEGNTTQIEGHYIPSPREPLLVRHEVEGNACHSCPLCALNLNVKHTDVLILSQFMRSDGCVLPRRVTGLCGWQQRRIQWLVAMAQKAGLMPNLAPAWSKRDPKKRYGSKKFNRYFDESTLPDR